jgi:hypothetical protein
VVKVIADAIEQGKQKVRPQEFEQPEEPEPAAEEPEPAAEEPAAEAEAGEAPAEETPEPEREEVTAE